MTMQPDGELDLVVEQSGGSNMTELQWKEFWKHLLNEAWRHDAWWLDTWLEDRMERYMMTHREAKDETR